MKNKIEIFDNIIKEVFDGFSHFRMEKVVPKVTREGKVYLEAYCYNRSFSSALFSMLQIRVEKANLGIPVYSCYLAETPEDGIEIILAVFLDS